LRRGTTVNANQLPLRGCKVPLSSNVSGGISSELALPFLYASGDDLHILEFQWLPY